MALTKRQNRARNAWGYANGVFPYYGPMAVTRMFKHAKMVDNQYALPNPLTFFSAGEAWRFPKWAKASVCTFHFADAAPFADTLRRLRSRGYTVNVGEPGSSWQVPGGVLVEVWAHMRCPRRPPVLVFRRGEEVAHVA